MRRRFYYLDDFDPITSKDVAFSKRIVESTGGEVVFLPAPNGVFSTCQATPIQRKEMLTLALEKTGEDSISSDFALLDALDPEAAIRSLIANHVGERLAFLIREDNIPTIEGKGLGPLFSKTQIQAIPIKKVSQTFGEELISPACPEEVRNLVDPCLGPEVRAYIEKERLYYVRKLGSFLKSEHRLKHSLSVANLSYAIAYSNGFEEPILAYVAGVLHDLGKHCPESEEKAIMIENFPEYIDFPPWTFHQFTGAYLAKKEFAIERQEILQAIESHATGKANMSAFGKIIYSADKIDPLRGYDSSWMIEECKTDYGKGFLTVLRENRAYLTEKGYRVDNPLTKECFKMYLKD